MRCRIQKLYHAAMEFGRELAALVDLCQRLVRVPSPSGQERAVADLVLAEMRSGGFDDALCDELGNVVGVRRSVRPGPTLLFDAHMDVVAATEPERWQRDPFSGALADGRVWGRGSTDTKGSLAAAIRAIADLAPDSWCGTLAVSASVGEEHIEGAALARVCDQLAPTLVVICEPTALQLGLGHRGRCTISVETQGRAAHSSRPELGDNAVYKMVEAIARIRALPLQRDDLLGPGVCELIDIRSSPWPGTSMVPPGCSARFDRRLVRGETRDSVLDELRRALSGLSGTSVVLQTTHLACDSGTMIAAAAFHPAWALAASDRLVKRSQQAMQAAGLTAELYYAPFCTNGAMTAGVRGIPTLVLGAGDIAAAHVVDESVAVEQLTGAYVAYQVLARELAQPG